ncbi:MAG: putative ABC transporter permease [Candidatus Shapirobacteria bacterium]|nr:putative ABC transporter permease [Candidatus Shapirobacteria bacterium]
MNFRYRVLSGDTGEIDLQITFLKHFFLFFQKMFIYFWVFSIVGHFLELIWIYILPSGWYPITPTIMPLAPPYGLGVVAIIVLVIPLVKKYKLNVFSVFILCTLVSSSVEYLCAAFIVLFYGYNKFWDYSSKPFNLNGYIYLQNMIIFGILTTIFLYFIYPFFNKFLQKLRKHQIDIIFWIFFSSYTLDVLLLKLRFLL